MKRTILKLTLLAAALLAAGVPEARSQFTAVDVGGPANAGSTTPSGGGFTITGGGGEIGGTNDQFHFNYQQYTGDFDVKVRVESLGLSDAWAKAGLVARENLTGGSRFAGVFCTPDIGGDFFRARLAAAGQATNMGAAPVTFPNSWLRLQRVGGTFNGYVGIDGISWMQLGSVPLTNAPGSPASMFVGMAVNSRVTNDTVTAVFQQYANVPGGAVVVSSLDLGREPLGPSTRRTGLAFSEIMYHPRTVPGFTNRSLEFIELFNSMSIPEDLSGHRLSGSIDYAFPNGTIIKPGQFLVIARDPGFLQSQMSISGVLGPWTGATTNSLPGSSGLILLRNPAGAVLLQVRYQGRNPWPIAADGAGHSLVLSRPSYGEGDYKAWAASDSIDGSPGKAEPFGADALSPVVLNEFLAHTDLPLEDYIELFNRSTQPVDLSNAYLTDEASTNKYRIANGTVIPARGFIHFTETQLGFALSSTGERIYLVNSSQTRVIDAVDFGAQLNGVSSGRYPDGAPTFSILSARTPGTANAPVRISDVVINEIMFSPISGNNSDEYVELYNRTGFPINVGGWRLLDGISYTLPAGAVIPAGGYLVVANNVTNLMPRYPALNATNTYGNYSGSLGNSGDRIALAIPDYSYTTNATNLTITTNISHAVVNEVTYGKGGRWGNWSDGGGSSLELVDPDSDNRQSANWADSDETAKSTWTNIEVTGNPGQNLGTANQLLVYLLGVGECLVDDVEVRVNNGANLITNPGFESDLAGWTVNLAGSGGQAGGSHDHSTIENTGFTGSKSLHIRAGSRGDDSANSIRSPAVNINAANTTLRAKARWLRGHPELLLRARGGSLEVSGKLALPANLGTPGARNSRAIINAGPAVFDVAHAPVLPVAGEPVVVTARASDPDGISSMVLKYRVDSTNTVITPAMFASVTMLDDGSGGDKIAGDGIYSATIPPQVKGASVGFYVEARDNPVSGPQGVNTFPQGVFPTGGLTRCFPSDSYSRECIVRWGDQQVFGSFATYHLWVTLSTAGRWNDRHELCNTPLDGTFVYNNYRVIYNCLPQFAGSPWHAGSMTGGPTNNLNRVDYVCNFPVDDRFLGVTDTVLNTVGNPGGDNVSSDFSAQSEQGSYLIFKEMGIHYNYRRYMHFFLNGNQRSVVSATGGGPTFHFIMEDSQQPNGDAIAEWFPDDTAGELYKIEDWFAFSDQGYNAGNDDADLTRRMTIINATNTLNPASYRFMWRKRSVGAGESASDYTSLYKLIDAASPITITSNNAPIADPDALLKMADIEQWMRIFACQHAVGNWDSYGYERGKNAFTYKPSNGGFNQWTWDIDFTLGLGGRGTSDSLFSANDPRIQGIWNTPVFRRMYMRAFMDMTDRVWNRSFLDPIFDAKAAAFALNNIGVQAAPLNTIKTFITGRRDYILGQITNLVNAPFNFAGTNEFTTTNNLLVISGTAPVGVKDIYINGVAYPITWTSVTGWTARVVLAAGTNYVNLQPYRDGLPTTNPVRTITAVYDGQVPDPRGTIVFNEIMYNPAAADASYVELFNSSTAAFDLSGWKVNGLGYEFPPASTISGRQYLLLVKNRAGFSSVYTNVVPFAQFDGSLDPDGETLTLLKPGASGSPDLVIDKVRYEARAPWGIGANGGGAALQLIDVAQDNSRVSNWTDHEEWRYVTYTGFLQGNITNNGAFQDTNFSIYLNIAGDVYVDDMQLVLGTVAGAGPNLLQNGGFEAPLDGIWAALGTHSGSVLSTSVHHTGSSSLHVIATGPGNPNNGGAAVRQVIPGLTAVSNVATLSFWMIPSTNGGTISLRTRPGAGFQNNVVTLRPTTATPGAINSVAQPAAAYDPIWLNELQAENNSGPTDNAGEREPWVELFNAGNASVDLTGYYLANNYDTNLTQWQFPSGSSIAPGEFKVIWADGETGETVAGSIHAGFRLNASTGSVALVRLVDARPQIVDYLTYAGLAPDLSYGDYPDGQPFNRTVMRDATPGATNTARFVSLYINEWLAGNTNTIADPADGQFQDWFEIYNAGTNAVDIGGFYFTDNPGGNTNNYTVVPSNGHYVVPAGGYLLVWADNEAAQNSPARPDLHVDFQLAKTGETIALIAPDGRTIVDLVTFANQTDDVTTGRYPDGSATITTLGVITPRAANILTDGNTAPQLTAIADRTIRYGQTLSITASATDAGAPPQILSFALDPGAPAGAGIGSGSGVFTWTPAANQVPSTNSITVRVSDDGTPSLSAARTFKVIVLPPPHTTVSLDGGGNFTLTFDTVAGRSYQVQFKNDLNDSVWLPLSQPVVANAASITALDNVANSPRRFFRVVQLD